MPLQAKAIKQKMKSVGNIKKITKTMEMVSVSKMRKAVAHAQDSRAYTLEVLSLIHSLSRDEEVKATNPFFANKTEGRVLVIAVASNKGLCGSYNLNIYKRLLSLKKNYRDNIDCIAIGKFAEKSAVKLGIPLIASFTGASEKTAEVDSRLATKIATEHFLTKEYKEVVTLYTEFVKATEFSATIRKILPLDSSIIENIIFETDGLQKEAFNQAVKKENKQLAEYLFEPSRVEMLNAVAEKLVNAVMYQALLESMASEHSSRMFAMKTASDNATEIFNDLKLSFNHARQDAITKELSEIVGGAAALEVA